MSWIHSRSAAIAGLFGLGVLTVPAVLLVHRAPLASAAAVVAISVTALWLTGVYWKRLDEAARTAQQWAWLWGGSVGLGLGIAATFPPISRWWLPTDIAPALLAPTGAVVAGAAAIAGFLVAWAAWWLRHR